MGSRKRCGQLTVDGTPCRNPARSCTADHPAAAGSGGAPSRMSFAAAHDPLAGGVGPGPATPGSLTRVGVKEALGLFMAKGVRFSRRRRADLATRIVQGSFGAPTPRLLGFLANVTTDKVTLALVARHRETPPKTLAELAKSPYRAVRANVAANPSATPRTLARLADGTNIDARRNVADNPATEPDVLERLADDPVGQVREQVARNPRTPGAALARLAASWGSEADYVATNSSAPPEVLAGLAARATAARPLSVRAASALARNRATPPDVLAGLISHSVATREDVANNPSTPPEVLARLAADPSPGVRAAALGNPSTPAAGRAAAGLLTD